MITSVQFKTLDDLYTYYNRSLFGGALPECIVNLSRHCGAYGFFIAGYWKTREKEALAHEISLNPDHINRPDIEWHSTLVHEMVHLWQQEFGNPGRRFYHNAQFAAKMEQVGLMPSGTHEPGGRRTGQHMGHYVIEAGPFQKAFDTLSEGDLLNLRLLYKPNIIHNLDPVAPGDPDPDSEEDPAAPGDPGQESRSTSGRRVKYTCPCGFNVWGKPGLSIRCCVCESFFEPFIPSDDD